jgi:hypothetical protein
MCSIPGVWIQSNGRAVDWRSAAAWRNGCQELCLITKDLFTASHCLWLLKTANFKLCSASLQTRLCERDQRVPYNHLDAIILCSYGVFFQKLIQISLVTSWKNVRFEVFMAVTLKNAIFWDLHHVALVRTNILEECSASIIRVTRISELGTTLAATSNRHMLWRNTMLERKHKYGIQDWGWGEEWG